MYPIILPCIVPSNTPSTTPSKYAGKISTTNPGKFSGSGLSTIPQLDPNKRSTSAPTYNQSKPPTGSPTKLPTAGPSRPLEHHKEGNHPEPPHPETSGSFPNKMIKEIPINEPSEPHNIPQRKVKTIEPFTISPNRGVLIHSAYEGLPWLSTTNGM